MDMAWILPAPMHSSGVLFMCLDHKGPGFTSWWDIGMAISQLPIARVAA